MAAVVEIQGLRKTYWRWRGGSRPALAGFDMLVEPGQVHGFLGPNGSGKTTTLRALLGLVAANAGQLRLLGQTAPSKAVSLGVHRGVAASIVRRLREVLPGTVA